MHSRKKTELQYVNIDRVKIAADAKTKAEAAKIIRDAGFSPVPLKSKEKTAFLLNWPALAYVALADDEIDWLFTEDVEIGIVLGNGIFAIDNDFDDSKESRRAEKLQFEILGPPLARRRGNPARYADIYLDDGWKKPPRKLTEAAERAVEVALDYRDAQGKREGRQELNQLKEDAHKAYAEFKLFLARHCQREVLGKKKDVEIRGFGSQIAVPPSYHAKSKADYFWDDDIETGDGLAGEADTLDFMQALYPDYRAPVRGECGEEMPGSYTDSYEPWRLGDLALDAFEEERDDGSRDLASLLGKIVYAVACEEGLPVQDLDCPDFRLNVFDIALDYIDRGETPGIERHLGDNARGFEGKLAYDVLNAVSFAVRECVTPPPKQRKPKSKPDEDLTLSEDFDYDTNLDRATARFVLYTDKRDNYFLDLTRIGEPGWQTACTAFKNHYRRIFRTWVDERDKVRKVLLGDELLDQHYLKSARRLQYNPRWPRGFIGTVPDGAVNLYVAPEHPDSDGEVQTFLKFFKHLIPAETDRKRILKRLAYKLQKPWTRGTAIMMVADNTFGCGRGLLFQVLELLFGYTNVKTKEFQDVISSNWNEWLCESLIINVPEVKAFKDAWRFSSRAEVYEKLKDVIDPGNARHDIRKRHIDSFSAEIFPLFMLATNHIDALPITADDRRFDVVANGKPISARLRDDILRWMNDPKNIGALWRYLEETDASDIDPFGVPPTTFIKRRMIEARMSSIDLALDDLIRFTRENDIELVTTRHIETFVGGHAKMNETGLLPEDQLKLGKIISHWRTPLLRDKNRVRLEGSDRQALYIFTYKGKLSVQQEVIRWSNRTEKEKRAEINRVTNLIDKYRKS